MNYIAAPSCSATPSSTLLYRSAGISPWTLFTFNYTAIGVLPTLVFGFKNSGGADYTYLDDVSVVEMNVTSDELLNNPSFEKSTSTPTGWITWCQSACGGGAGQVVNSSCYSGNCFRDHCQNGFNYLAQSFSATIGRIYQIKFRLYQVGGGNARLYAAIQG